MFWKSKQISEAGTAGWYIISIAYPVFTLGKVVQVTIGYLLLLTTSCLVKLIHVDHKVNI